MKRLYISLFALLIQVTLFAQRMRARPEDYEDYPDYGSSSADFPASFWIIVLIIFAVVIIWFKISLNSSRNEEIRNKTVYLTKERIKGFVSAYRATTENGVINKPIPKEDFVDNNGVVGIPPYAKCIILEYYKDNHSFVKVKFDDYSQPLYIGRWYLRTPNKINT